MGASHNPAQINLLTAVMNDAPVLPDEDDEVGDYHPVIDNNNANYGNGNGADEKNYDDTNEYIFQLLRMLCRC